jgi:hypothetical protein
MSARWRWFAIFFPEGKTNRGREDSDVADVK